MKALVLTAIVVAFLSGCGKDPYAADPEAYDNDLTEEAFRFLFDRFPHAAEEVVYCIVWGYKITPVPDRFVARFADIKREVVSYSAVKTAIVGTDATFRLKEDTNAVARPVAFIQVVMLPPGEDGKKTMEVGWTYQNRSKRELVAIDENRPGLERFSVIRDITWHSRKTEPDGPANRSQPIRADTNRTSVVAGSDR
jgi:hypothetical protein